MNKEQALNQEITQEIVTNNQNLKRYVEWAVKNGVIMDKIQFPAAFGPSHSYYLGSACKEVIYPNEAFIYIPNKCLITVERALSSEIGFIFENHDNLFKANEDRDFYVLAVFLLFEFQKGPQSFWEPYFSAVDPGELSCYWDDKRYLQSLDDRECYEEIKAYGKSMDEMWTNIRKVLRVYSPDYFQLKEADSEEGPGIGEAQFRHVAAFIATRCFGWGLPTTILAPIADSLNHSSKSSNHIDLINKRLHPTKNKIYTYLYNFEAEEGEEPYDKMNSKLQFNVKRLFKEDQQLLSDPEMVKLIEGKAESLEAEEEKEASNKKGKKRVLKEEEKYDEQEVFTRFSNLLRAETENLDEDETEESKKEKFPNHGMELWGIGYVSSDYEQDNDEDAHEEEEPNDSAVNEELKRKILKDKGGPEDFEVEEFEQISSNTRLREIYSYRWWQDESHTSESPPETYFVMVNRHSRDLLPGEQLYYNYGKRTNAYLLENYGFVLDESNQYNSLEFRVILGTNPKEQINLAQDLLPSTKILEDRDNLDTTTEKISLKPQRLSEGLMAYLRSILQNNYSGSDSEFLMVSSPRVIEYELLALDFAIDLLESFGRRELFKRRSLEQDLQAYEAETDFRLRFILQHNIQLKKIYHAHLKLLRVVKAILERLQFDQDTFTRATLRRVEGIEDDDSEWELFKRRMGMRNYFKELKMNLQRIKKSKEARAKTGASKPPKEEKKKTAKPKAKTKEEGERQNTEQSVLNTTSATSMSTVSGANAKTRGDSKTRAAASSQGVKPKSSTTGVAVKKKKK